ncbi:heterokaryon incompatibility protein-domain-containing protein [Xylaria acuta]|nr:heterokaryon incompatibility protein-domain-containing protein [Xylaria acuta]
MATAQPYLHEPLPSARSIRLISLAPSTTSNAEIRCTISATDFDSVRGKDAYEALSYVWGSPTGTVPICCNGGELPVTLNCHDALRRLRRRFLPRVLWIDAICIDQRKDNHIMKERNSQVQMMGEIFREARTVLIWLGSGDESTHQAFRLLRAIGWLAYDSKHPFAVPRFAPKSMGGRLVSRLYGDNDTLTPKKPKVLKRRQAIQAIFDNPWFFRVWTMQESVFARNCLVLCGKTQLSWHVFSAAILSLSRALLNNALVIFSTRFTTRMTVLGNANTPKSRSGLDKFWSRAMGHLNSSLPQDRVYGLYSILSAQGLDLKPIDYEMPISEIYGDAAKAFIKREPHSLDILYLSIRPFGYDELPTWTPNWTTGHPHIINENTGGVDFTGHLYFAMDPYRASGNSLAAVPRPCPPNELQVRGIIIGKVSRIVVSSSAAEPPDPARMKTRVSAFTQACRKFVMELDLQSPGGPYKDPLDIEHALLFTLIFYVLAIRKHGREKRLDPLDMENEALLWLSLLHYPNCGDLPTRDLEAVAGLEDANTIGERECLEVIDRVLDWDRIRASRERVSGETFRLLNKAVFFHSACCELANYAFLFLDTGHIGRAYFNSRENDRVALLAGSKAPFLLREVEDGQDRYQVVAPAYIHGVMDGELWPDDDESGVKDMILV